MFVGLQYFRKPAPAPTPTKQAQQIAPTPATAASGASGPAGSTPAVAAAAAQTTVVDTPLYRVTFSNKGGQAVSWVLKKYNELGTNKPQNLVNERAAQKFGYPLSLYTYDPGMTAALANALYVPSATGVLEAPAELTFRYATDGVEVTKTFSFDNSYVLRAHVSVTRNGAPVMAALAWPSGLGDQATLPQYASATLDASENGQADQVDIKKVSGGNTLRGTYDWAGISDQYFAAIFLPQAPASAGVVTLHNAVDIPRDVKKPNGETTPAPVLGAALADTNGPLDTRLFVGPKTLSALSAVKGASGPNLDKLVNFGWWSVIATPLFLILRFFHNHVVANWGWAILFLTVLLSIVTLPSRIYMMRSSLKMQRIQPQMDAIKQRYAKYKATDPKRQEMNAEIMKLQKDNGVNMFGSCLPMLIQWPLLFAFYRMLSNVFELRQAHWLWVPDLSSPDPLHLLPILFVGSMFLVQYLTPSPGVDPQQQRMMAFTMPAVFGFMTWSIGAGLALYWAASNLFGILTQMAMNRTTMGREMREIALRRAAKKTGKVINAKVVQPKNA